MTRIHLLRSACWTSVLIVALAAGCRRSNEPEPEAPSASPHPMATSGEVVVRARSVSDSQVDILIANGTKAPINARRALRIEQWRGDQWFVLEGVGSVWIRDNCDPIEGVLYPEGMGDECMILAPETVIEVEPWLGTIGDAQCACEECVPVPGGQYRVVLHDCHGGRFDSDQFGFRLRDEEE